jgi:plastocyanin
MRCMPGLKHRRGALPVLVPVLALLLLSAPAAQAANHTVHVGGSGLIYTPSSLTIQAGDSVTWTNDGGFHNVAADDHSFRCANGCDGDGGNGSPASAPWTATHTFSQAGTFGYHCEVHGPNGMIGTIVVQAAPPPPATGTLRFSQSSYSASEAVGNATITVSRAGGSDGAASVSWQASPGTATAADFTPGSGTLTWADKDAADKTFQVHVINDTLAEPTETVRLSLSGASGASLDDARKSATLNILDNDGSTGGVPLAPAGLTANAVSTSEIDLSWHDVNGEATYRIERKTLGGTYQEIGTVGANVTAFADSGLTEATAYSYRVRAENGSGRSPYSNEAVAATDATAAPCIPSSTVLCLNNGRFSAHVAWKTSTGGNDGTTVPLASAPDSGLFYFFSPTNIEMLIKVLNACALTPPRYWVFYAATTNVQLTVTVTDTQTGKTKVYFNPLSTTAAPVQDVNAFATCP